MTSTEGTPFAEYLDSWEINLRARRRAAGTIRLYRRHAEYLADFVAERRPSWNGDPLTITRADIEKYIAECVETLSPNTAKSRWIAIRAFYAWLVDVDELDVSPAAKIRAPRVPETVVEMPTLDDVRKVLKVCSGRDFWDRRDTAIIYLFVDTGMRVSELAALRTDDVNYKTSLVVVREGKGGDGRVTHVGASALDALDKYKRARTRHAHAKDAALWLGHKGAMSVSGIRAMIARRGDEASVPGLHPHQLRHLMASESQAAGMSEADLMKLGGWRSQSVMRRYGNAAAVDRAIEAHRKYSPGDRL